MDLLSVNEKWIIAIKFYVFEDFKAQLKLKLNGFMLKMNHNYGSNEWLY